MARAAREREPNVSFHERALILLASRVLYATAPELFAKNTALERVKRAAQITTFQNAESMGDLMVPAAIAGARVRRRTLSHSLSFGTAGLSRRESETKRKRKEK